MVEVDVAIDGAELGSEHLLQRHRRPPSTVTSQPLARRRRHPARSSRRHGHQLATALDLAPRSPRVGISRRYRTPSRSPLAPEPPCLMPVVINSRSKPIRFAAATISEEATSMDSIWSRRKLDPRFLVEALVVT